MLDFTDVEPDAVQRRVRRRVIMRSAGTLNVDVPSYTPGTVIRQFGPDEILSITTSEEDASDAISEARIVVKGNFESLSPFLIEIEESMRDMEEQDVYHRIFASSDVTIEYDIMGKTTTFITQGSKYELNNLVYQTALRTYFADELTAALTLAFDESRGDHIDLGGRMVVSMMTFFEAIGYTAGFYPAYARAIVEDGVYVPFTNISGQIAILRTNDTTSGKKGFDYWIYRQGHRVKWSITKTGLYIYRDENPAPLGTRTVTKDQYSSIRATNDAKYGKSYTVEMRGDSRLEVRDALDIDEFGLIRINRIETSYDGAEKCTISGYYAEQ